jgi:hypothetical protein
MTLPAIGTISRIVYKKSDGGSYFEKEVEKDEHGPARLSIGEAAVVEERSTRAAVAAGATRVEKNILLI